MRITRHALLVCVTTFVLGSGCSSSSNSGDNNGGSGGGEGGSGGGSGGSGGSSATGGKGGTAGGSAGASGSGGATGGSGGAATGGSGGATGGAGGAVGGMAGGGAGGAVVGNPLEGNPQAVLVEGKSGFDSEGPLWIASGGYLLFSDVNNAKIWKLEPDKPANMRFTEYIYKAGVKTNGLALDADGNLLVCERETGTIGKKPLASGTPTVLVNKYNNMPLKAPNDIVVGKNGNVYFTDPIWGSGTTTNNPASAYRIDKMGMISLITTGANKPGNPNGIALSPDEKTLYVGDDMAGKVWKYTVATDGTPSGAAEFVSLATPDGIAIDTAGNVYIASNSATKAIVVYKPDGSKIGQITLPASPSNASFGGADLKTLYITVGGSIYSVKLGIAGIP